MNMLEFLEELKSFKKDMSEKAQLFLEELEKNSERIGKPVFTENGLKILQCMQKNQEKYINIFKAKDIGEILSMSPRSVSGSMKKLLAEQYVEKTGDDIPTVIASTASPYKFANSVLSAVSDQKGDSEFDTVRVLSDVTKTEIPTPIKALEAATVRFKEIREKDDMLNAVYSALNI